MIFKSYDEKGNLKGLIVRCSCYCSEINFMTYDNVMYVSVWMPCFATEQNYGKLTEIADNIKSVIKKKKNYKAGILLSKKEMNEVLDALSEFTFTHNDEDEVEPNDGRLILDYKYIDGEQDIFEMQIISTVSIAKSLRGKGYRANEVMYTEEEWKSLYKKMCYYVKTMEKKHS